MPKASGDQSSGTLGNGSMKRSLPTRLGFVLSLLVALGLILGGYLSHPEASFLYSVILICTLALAAMYFPLVFRR